MQISALRIVGPPCVMIEGLELTIITFQGTLFDTVRPDDSTWTLEDKRTIRILLAKARPEAGNCWKALLQTSALDNGETFQADSFTVDQMQRKLTLERFQKEVSSWLSDYGYVY